LFCDCQRRARRQVFLRVRHDDRPVAFPEFVMRSFYGNELEPIAFETRNDLSAVSLHARSHPEGNICRRAENSKGVRIMMRTPLRDLIEI